ncbi:MAG: acyl-CoA thioesterase [Ginsengibacter sp.]
MNKTPSSYYTVRFGDCDLFAHLNNARYLDYFINAREDHLKEAYGVDLALYYQQGISWVVGTHQITYLRPAAYNERVFISSTLIELSTDLLLVEMIMTDEKQSHLKAFLWTKFIPINVTTGRKESHPENFMEFAKSIKNDETDNTEDYQKRLQHMVRKIKAPEIKT